ncbi:5-oxoprolinase subunit B family protein [Jiangella anatolica]|uniref:5-oxoprolinase subunit B family protein n=1 Tax=Jiangella anatolica TaxID=2670374 RepID=UPI0018F3E150|nr:allophanate hydrolase subunit 1 [Jiangella anatolica]
MRTSELQVLPCGDHAILVELPDLEDVLALNAALREHEPAGLVDVVPAAQTLLIMFDPEVTSAQRLTDDLTHLPDEPPATTESAPLEVAVRYDGPDLDAVAAAAGLSAAEVVERHTAATYTVAFTGFAPGFAYLTGLDPRLVLPRRDDPRTRVPAGSVAIADRYSGVYPRSGPGGWHLLGHTDAVLWDLDRTPPATLLPGAHVRFRAEDGRR